MPGAEVAGTVRGPDGRGMTGTAGAVTIRPPRVSSENRRRSRRRPGNRRHPMGQPIGSHGLTEDVGDGTNPRMAMPSPVPLGADRSKGLIEYARRLGYVDAAWTRCQ